MHDDTGSTDAELIAEATKLRQFGAKDVVVLDDGHADPDAPPPPIAGGLEVAGVGDWRVAKTLETLRLQINALAPARNRDSDGGIGDAAHASTNSDHNPWVTDGGMGVVTARDFTHDPEGGCDGTVLAEALRAARDPRVKYIIWNRRICSSQPHDWQPAWAWRPYSGKNAHTHHVHLSVSSLKVHYDSEAPWQLRTSLKDGAQPTAAIPPPAAPADAAAVAEIEATATALAGLAPLVQRLTDLQDSPDPTVSATAGELLARYAELARREIAAQPKPALPARTAPGAVETTNASSTRFEDLRDGYLALYRSCVVRPEWAGHVAWHRKKLLQYRPRYEPVAAATGAPWWFIGIVHALEGSFNFATHLHNGDPLTARTVRVPKDRPPVWGPPNDWESSAVDAITIEGYAGQADWSLARALYRFESYNGFGSRAKGINTPYLWSFSNHYAKGKFVADHVYDSEAVSKQCGAAVMLQALIKAGDVAVGGAT
jgi:lysozyme family protein